MPDARSLIDAAEAVVRILDAHGVDAVVIGAVAMAAHHHVRFTEDIDLAVNADLPSLRTISSALVAAEFRAELREPDSQDPLGGVIDVSGSFGLVQIISFAGRFPQVVLDAVASSTLAVREGSPLYLAPIAQLVALKLYAGGHKSKADILELLRRNPQLDLSELGAVCARYRLSGLDAIIAELQGNDDQTA